MAENYGSLEGVLDANETLEGEIDSHDEMSGEIQFTGGVGGVKDVKVNNESVVDENKVAHIDLAPYAEKEDVYDKDAVNTLLEGKADTEDIPTKLSQLDNDDNYVQDADYHHTDNNFTNEDKAAIGGIPENITDLSDVAVDNIQNGQVLKWDATQEKFVNANESGGGSGDVADVKVNGTSVVDPVTKEANIDLTGYAETSDIPTDLADLSDDATHRLVTDTEKSTWDNKADVSDIPTVNNNTITIQKNGQNVDSFTLNQDSNKAINIAVPTKTSDLQNDDSFITNTVNNLANYYLKSDTYTQTEVNNLISAAVNGRFEKVTVLPASGEPNVIYLVPKTTALTNNVYDEYIWQDNAWELLGSTEIDLSNYVTTTDLATALADYVTTSAFNTAIANYYTKTEVGNLLDEKVDKVSGKGLSTYDYDATAKGIVDNVTTNLAGKVDKVNGKGLSTEDYTTTEKNKLAGISTGANKVESSTTNGNIKIDGTETQVYDGSGKVDKVNGKGLSTNDYDNTDKAKVGMIDNTTTPVSGNPISIADLKSAQIALNPTVTYNPIQDLHGQSKPYPAGGGKNLIPMTVDSIKAANTAGTWSGNVYTYNGVTVTIITDNANNIIEFKVNGTCTGGSWAFVLTSAIPVSSGSYYINGNGSSATARLRYKNGSDWVYTNTTGSTDTPITLDSAYNLLVDIYIPNSTTFTNLLLHPMIRLSTVSDATFAPYSNICPISGYDKIEVLSCGKNTFKCDFVTTTINGITFKNNGDGTVTVNGTATANTFCPIETDWTTYDLVRNHNYFTDMILTGCPSGGSGATFALYMRSGNAANRADIGNGVMLVYSDTSTYYPAIFIGQGYTANNLIFKPMFRLATISDATFEPYHKTTDLSESLGQTLYRFTEDVRSGKITTQYVYTTFSGASDETIERVGTNISGKWRFVLTKTGLVTIPWSDGTHKSNMLTTNILDEVTNADTNACTVGIHYRANGGGNSFIAYFGDNYTTVDDVKALLQTTPLQVVYAVPTVTTIQLTPHEIALSQGYNYISTNGTSISMAYHNGELATHADVEQLGETMNELGNVKASNEYVLLGTITAGGQYLNQLPKDFKELAIYGDLAMDNITYGLIHYRKASSLIVDRERVVLVFGEKNQNDRKAELFIERDGRVSLYALTGFDSVSIYGIN